MLEGLVKKVTLRDVGFVLIGAFAIVAFWRGIWNLLDKFLLPNSFVESQVLSILIGVLILIGLSLYR